MSGWREETIGGSRLILGDCREVLPALGRQAAVLTDPPYGLRDTRSRARPTRYQRRSGAVAVTWDGASSQATVDLIRSLADTCIIWGGNYFVNPPSRGWLCWHKRGNAPSMADLELAWTDLDMNARSFEKSVKSASLEKDLRFSLHPTQKPVALMEWSIGFLPAGSVICDPCMGTGTTGVACVRLGRRFVGIEIDPVYFAAACERLQAAYRQADLFAERPPEAEQASLFEGRRA